MKRRLTALETAIMVAAAITACSDKNTETTTVTEVVTQAGIAAGVTDGETEGVGATSDLETAAGSQSSKSALQEAAPLEGAEGVPHTGAELEQSKIRPFVERVQKAVVDKDMEALAGLCVCPVYVSLGEGRGKGITDESAFLKMDASQIFTESLLEGIAGTDVDTLEQFGAGVTMSKENGIIFDSVDGQAAITGISLNQSMSERAMSGHAMKESKVPRQSTGRLPAVRQGGRPLRLIFQRILKCS